MGKYIIELDEKYKEICEQYVNGKLGDELGDYVNLTEIADAIANGTPYNPSGDAISREALKKAICPYDNTDYFQDIETILKIIDNAPTVEVYTLEDMQNNFDAGVDSVIGKYDRAKGEWKDTSEKNVFNEDVKCFECSNCHKTKVMSVLIYEKLPFCPNCGADMRGGATNEKA